MYRFSMSLVLKKERIFMDYKCIIKKSLLTIIILIAFIIICRLSVFYIPFLIAYIISLIMEPLIKWVQKKTNFTRKVSSIIVLITIFLTSVGLIVWGLVSLISEATNLLGGLNFYLEKGILLVQDIFDKIKLDNFKFPEELKRIGEGTATDLLNTFVNYLKDFLTKFLNYMTSIPRLFIYIVITLLATYFITSDKFYILDRMEHHLSRKMVGKISRHVKGITNSLGRYLKAEITMIGISFSIVLVGLNIFKLFGMNIAYPVLIAVLIGFVDALPILGTGSIMIPWVLIELLNKNYSLAICLLGLYILIAVVKQILEPKIVSSNIGIHPIFTLIAMYTGFKIIGIIGMLIGPIILIILKNIFSETIDKGIFQAIISKD